MTIFLRHDFVTISLLSLVRLVMNITQTAM
jgi:hypothetical protein